MRAIPYGRQSISEDDISAVVKVLKSDFLTQGPAVKEFETRFANYVGAKYAVAVANGTAALHLSVMALNLQPGEKVITTPITFAASANCVKYIDGDVIFADIDAYNYCIDIHEVRKLLENSPDDKIKGIIPVDFAGYAVNLEEYRDLADEFGLWIIEDACHAPGGYFINSNKQKQLCGNGKLADLSVFSFHPVKHIACGEGGMITTDSQDLYNKLLLHRTHGITKDLSLLNENHGGWYYEMQELGFNYRLTDIQAALGNSQLSNAEQGLVRRRKIAREYDLAFQDKEFILGQSGLIEGHAYHLYILEVKKRDELYQYLIKRNIFSQIHYIPVHLMPYYKQFGWKENDMPVAERYYKQCLSLPMFPGLTEKEQEYVIDTIISFYE